MTQERADCRKKERIKTNFQSKTCRVDQIIMGKIYIYHASEGATFREAIFS